MRKVGLEATASYLPERVFTAAELAQASGIPENVLVEKFGIRTKHIAAPDEPLGYRRPEPAGSAGDENPHNQRNCKELYEVDSDWRFRGFGTSIFGQ